MATKKKRTPGAKRATSKKKRATSTSKSSTSAAASGGAAAARTIVFIHGIGNKPTPEVLKCQWDHALFDFDLGERSRLAYWVDRERYPLPEIADCDSGDLVETEDEVEADTRGLTVKTVDAAAAESELEESLQALSTDEEAIASLRRLAREIDEGAASTSEADLRVRSVQAKVLPLPGPVRRLITRRLTRKFLVDVHDYFYVAERREHMRESLRERLRPGGGPFVVIGHSQGSMIAWDVLSDFAADELPVDLFVTIGAPLGLTEVRDQLKRIRQTKKLAVPECVAAWANFADPLDPVALDKKLRKEYDANSRGVRVDDAVIFNQDSPRNPHSGTGYLGDGQVRRTVRDAVELARFQPVTSFTLARDLVREMENAPAAARHEVLIELALPEADSDLGERRKLVRKELKRLGASEAELEMEDLRRFVAAKLTREEAEQVACQLGIKDEKSFAVSKVWRDAKKVALLERSLGTVHAGAAHASYSAFGAGIEWAILDTGINAKHPHFHYEGRTVVKRSLDCTRGDDPLDRFGHGTHVAGIVAGGYRGANGRSLVGIAPRAELHVYKVLDDNGAGQDSWIIKALDQIAETNEQAGQLVIHGVNLSLGGGFNQSVYACGHSPLCRELKRLWRQGVLVVIAAGNEGFATLRSTTGTIEANMDLSIGDPANLEEAIAVGSVHKEQPHSYGISYFSSRGPTADGRQKPDVVAPGEKICSARHRFASGEQEVDELYVEMSGTSMAAPHVSGVLAAFLSIRREFIGEPDKVKRILLDNCTDLGRDRPMQGAGVPNLVKMLVNT